MSQLRVVIIALCAVSLTVGCSGGSLKRDQEVAELTVLINRAHDQAIVRPDSPYLVESFFKREHFEEFSKANCKGKAMEFCEAEFKRELFDQLKGKYFSADLEVVKSRCSLGRLGCTDPRVIESWVRESHNTRVEISRSEKIPKIEEWRSGKISNDALKSALSLNSDGE
jgi:hypothetical protein